MFSPIESTEDQFDDELDARRSGRVAFLGIVVVAITTLVFVWQYQLASVAVCLCVLLIAAGKLWFLAAMLYEMGGAAVLVFLVPFFDWAFLFNRFDVAWRPVVLQFLGLLFLFAGLSHGGS